MYWMNYTKWTYGFVRLKAADSVFISKTNIRRRDEKLVVGILILASFGLAACGNSNNTSQADTKKQHTN